MAVSLKRLSELSGVSGCEGAVRGYLEEIIRDKCDSVRTDTIGNLIAFRRGRSDKKKVLLGANMDEPGFIVSGITDSGYIKFKSVGSIDPRTVISKRVVIGNGVKGVIGMKAIHLQTKKEREAAVELSSLYIDIGCTKKSGAEKKVALGDYITFDTGFYENGNILRGKALGRFGVLCLIKAMEVVPAYDTYFVFSAQREIPCRVPGRGMACAAYAVKPDMAVIADVLSASDFIGENGHTGSAALGGGAVIEYMDKSSIGSAKLISMVKRTAEAYYVTAQEKVCSLYSTEAGAVQTAAEGCPAVCIGIPCRYKNTPVSMMNRYDLDNAAGLCAAVIKESDVIIDEISKNDQASEAAHRG